MSSLDTCLITYCLSNTTWLWKLVFGRKIGYLANIYTQVKLPNFDIKILMLAHIVSSACWWQ